jgi:hypothetical protein
LKLATFTIGIHAEMMAKNVIKLYLFDKTQQKGVHAVATTLSCKRKLSFSFIMLLASFSWIDFHLCRTTVIGAYGLMMNTISSSTLLNVPF